MVIFSEPAVMTPAEKRAWRALLLRELRLKKKKGKPYPKPRVG